MFGVRGHDIQDVAFIGIQHALQRRLEIFLVNDPFALHSKSATELHIIRVDPISIFEDRLRMYGLDCCCRTDLPIARPFPGAGC